MRLNIAGLLVAGASAAIWGCGGDTTVVNEPEKQPATTVEAPPPGGETKTEIETPSGKETEVKVETEED